MPPVFGAGQLNGEPQSEQKREQCVELVIHEKYDEKFDGPIERCRGQLRESRIRQNDVCRDPDQIREKHAEQGEAANNIKEVDAFVDRDWMRSLIERLP